MPTQRTTSPTLGAAKAVAGAVLLAVAIAGCESGADEENVATTSTFSQHATWSPIADGPLDPRYSPLSVSDGERVYILGGYHADVCGPGGDCSEADPPLSDGAVYDPATDTWRPIADSPVGLSGQAVVVGGVLYVHTYPVWEGPPSAFLSYEIATDTWTRHPNPMEYGWLTATDDTVVVFGDRPRDASVYFDVSGDRWHELPANPFWKDDSGYPAWTGSEFIVSTSVPSHLGHDPPLVKLVALDESLRQWTDLGVTGIVGTAQLAVGDRVVWPSPEMANGGGEGTGDWGAIYPEGGIYDPESGDWADLPPLPPGYGGICCAVATDQLVSVSGNLLDPVSLEWTEVPPPDGGERHYSALAAAGDRLLVWGGVAFDDSEQTLLDSGFILETAP